MKQQAEEKNSEIGEKNSEIEALKLALSDVTKEYKDAEIKIKEKDRKISDLKNVNDSLSEKVAKAFQAKYDEEMAPNTNGHSQLPYSSYYCERCQKAQTSSSRAVVLPINPAPTSLFYGGDVEVD